MTDKKTMAKILTNPPPLPGTDNRSLAQKIVEGSFEGWNFKTWFDKNKVFFIRNKDSLKSMISSIAAMLALSYPENFFVKLLFGLGGAYGTKILLDAIDYFLSENPA